MGGGRCIFIVLVAGCRLHFAELDDAALGGDGTAGDSTTDGGQGATCARAIPTMPTFWVDTNAGLDTNPGTQAAPTKTIARALSLTSASGGTIIVAPGNYLESLDISTTQPLLLLSEQRYAARMQRVNCAGCSELTVEGFEITGSALPLVSITAGARVTIRDNVVFDGSSAGIRITSGSTEIVIDSNVVYDSFASHIHVNDADNVTIRSNVLFDDNGPSGGLAKLWLETAANTKVEGNIVFRSLGDNASYGLISLRDTTGATVVENNLVAGSPNATNVYASIGFDMATGTSLIRHNTFIGPMPGTAFGLGAGAMMTGSNFTVVNNLWASTGTLQPFTDGNAVALVALRHNLYWNAPLGPFQPGGSPNPSGDTQAIVANPGLPATLPAAPTRIATGFVGDAKTTCEVHAQLVEAMAKIATTSPAKGAADPTQSPAVDIRGNARPALPAIGAYEP
ncbi:MAG TPA: right-handed parallel beta-helix repeat-containing protein [Kofleriaceae bacterium]|nr:right-handed parallel beta-helix repeat-containing protein [Kofleriaceae bacterium]